MAAVAEAQSALRGYVQSESSRRLIVGAEITIASLRRTTWSNGVGRYFLESVPAGTHQVVVRALGYRPLIASLTIDDAQGHADTVDIDFVLSHSTVVLPTLTVEAKAPRFESGKMTDFERRRRLGFGIFVDRDQLRGYENTPLSITLRTLVSVRMVVRPQNCGGGFAAASGRGGSMGDGGQKLYCGDPYYAFAPACYLSIYLDGVRVWAWDHPEPPNLDDFAAASLEGIEVYRGASELPAELLATGNHCGALLLWTRVGEAV